MAHLSFISSRCPTMRHGSSSLKGTSTGSRHPRVLARALAKSTHMGNAPATARGFTLLQVVIVVSIMACLAAIGIPFMNTALQTRRLNGATRQITSDLRYVQSLAISKDGLYRLLAGTDASVSPARPNNYLIQSSPDGGTTWAQIGQWVNIPAVYPGVTFTITATGGSSLTQIQFNSRGVALNPTNPTFPINVNVTGLIHVTSTTNQIAVQRTGAVTIAVQQGL